MGTILKADDYAKGQLVTIHSPNDVEILLPNGEKVMTTPINLPGMGEPFKIESICLPYVAVSYLGKTHLPYGTVIHLDTRTVNLMKINKEYLSFLEGKPVPPPPQTELATVNPFAQWSQVLIDEEKRQEEERKKNPPLPPSEGKNE